MVTMHSAAIDWTLSPSFFLFFFACLFLSVTEYIDGETYKRHQLEKCQ